MQLERFRCIDVATRFGDKRGIMVGQNGREAVARETPWECPFTATPPLATPLPRDEARYVLALYDLLRFYPRSSVEAEDKELPAMFALCTDDSNPETRRISYLGSETLNVDRPSAYVIYELNDEGYVRKEKEGENDEDISQDVPELVTLLDEYEEDCDGEGPQHPQCRISATYEMAHDNLLKVSDAPTSSIVLDFTWRGVRELLDPPPSSAHIFMKIRNVYGEADCENQIPTSAIRAELEQLSKWDRILAGDNWPDIADEERTASSLAATVDAFLNQIKQEGPTVEMEEPVETAFDFIASSPLPARPDMDFTERFWKFAQGAVNRADLVDALTAVIEELETGRLQPPVNKANHSAFANVIRDCFKLVRLQTSADYDDQKEAIGRIFDYWLEQPMEVMVGIGISKLKRDYCHYLIGNEVASWDRLEPFLDETLPLEEQVLHLRRLHRVFELWSLLRFNVLHMPHEVLRIIIQAALEQYHKDALQSAEGGSHVSSPEATLVYRVAVPRYLSGGSWVEGIMPVAWTITLEPEDHYGGNFKGDLATHQERGPVHVVQLAKMSGGVFREDVSSAWHTGTAIDLDEFDTPAAATEEDIPSEHTWRMVKGSGRWI
ncbi:hypothetical protein HK104_000925 [Borealophlyctis nickersoniae]|nr:hypothetical protein HK104_000925 [Borealophlyctis nickersoniae]